MAVRHLEHEFTLSYRHDEAGHRCAFLTLIETGPSGQRSVELSKHLVDAHLERLIDDSLVLLRAAVLAHVLFPESPF